MPQASITREEKEKFEAVVASGVAAGTIYDRRAEMPRGVIASGPMSWATRKPGDVLGACLHQNASPNQNPVETARYHTSESNHITPGIPLAGICYAVAISDDDKPAALVSDLESKTYSQGAPDDNWPGEENRHLVAVLVMGRFYADGYKGAAGPTDRQMKKLEAVVAWLESSFGFGAEGLFGHYHFGKASCPGTFLRRWIEDQRKGSPDLKDDREWQEALLRWQASCLPKFGADGSWGRESKTALVAFQKAHGLKLTGVQDPFTELVLLRKYRAR